MNVRTSAPGSSPGSQVDKPEESCGVFGIYAPDEAVAPLTYFGLFALQHRGQESAGIVTFDQSEMHQHKAMGLVSQVFDDDILKRSAGANGGGSHPVLHHRF
jgi:amidophosphoribosyltransferase